MVNELENRETNAVAGLLGSLPRVEAPKDFDFRVKARIASGQPTRVSWFPTAARVAVPLGLVLSVGGYLGYQAVYQPVATEVVTAPGRQANGAVIPPRETEISTSNATSSPSPDEVGNEKIVIKPPVVDDKMLASSNTGVSKPTISGGIPTANRGGGSFDTAVKVSKTIYPRGVNPNAKVSVRPRDFDRPGAILAKDVLTQFGVDVVYSESGWRVAAVKDNSAAQKAGLKSGDVVEAINDQTLNEKTAFRGQFSGKSMRLKRDGAVFNVDLKKP